MTSSAQTRLDPPAGAGHFAQVSVADLAADLRTGRASPRDLVESALGAVEHWQPLLNAFVMIDEAGVRAEADRAAKELADGVDRGPLHGIPVGIKDLIDVQGLPTTSGSRHFAGHIASADADCVQRLRHAGAIPFGKTSTHEYAYGATGDQAANGPTHNPYGTGRMAGGSSSGSAAAVAAGILPLALGTDTGGSVRIPAACCGIVGLKTTFGAVPTTGVFPLAPSLDTVGPLARTAADCRLLWAALSADGQPPAAPAGAAPGTGSAPRIGWVPPDPIHPTAAEITSLARGLAGDLVVGEVDGTELAAVRTAYRIIQGSEAYAVHADRFAAEPELYGEEVRERLGQAEQLRGWEYVRARELGDRVRGTVLELLRSHDFLALPTIPLPPPPLGSRDGAVDGQPVNPRAALLALTSVWNVLGLPAISLPAGLVDGLPVALQLVGPPGSEYRLLAAAQTLEQPPSARP